jgi:hypothetical protein
MKVTDYCRALLVVKDFPSLLALLEARPRFVWSTHSPRQAVDAQV